MNNTHLISILTTHINANGKVNDAILCREIAEYIFDMSKVDKSINPITIYDYIYDFVAEYGEEEIETYCGRDEYGEKIYFSLNPETNWTNRITKYLKELGFGDNFNIKFIPIEEGELV